MANKRKKEINTETKKEEKVEESKNVTSLGYSGKVKIKFKIGDKYLEYDGHNNGTYTLKALICMFLCGYTSDAAARIPVYLDLYYSGDGTE